MFEELLTFLSCCDKGFALVASRGIDVAYKQCYVLYVEISYTRCERKSLLYVQPRR